MSKEINFNTMTDEEVENILNQIDSGETFEDEESDENDYNENDNESDIDDENSNEEADENSDEENDDEENHENLEDTENENDSDEELETNTEDDDSQDDTNSEEDDTDSENSQDEKIENKDDEETDTKKNDDENSSDTGTIDPSEYQKLKSFYDKVTNTEFIADGKKVKGFTDPDKIIRSQQMAYGFSRKMSGINEYRPFLKALKEKGLLEDESKFNFAMSLIDGDKAAIKEHMKTLKIDPVELDLNENTYVEKNYTASKEELILENALAQARESGVEDKLKDTIGKSWDTESFKEFLNNSHVREDLLEHMQTGVFDTVQDKIQEMERLDVYGSFSLMKSADKYRKAVAEINRENSMLEEKSKTVDNTTTVSRVDEILNRKNEEKKNEAKAAEYKAQVQKKDEADKARRKAVELSRKKSTVTKTKKFDPLSLDGEDFTSFVDGLISGKIK